MNTRVVSHFYILQKQKMRSEIKLFDDQFKFCRELKSKKLLRAFVEFMFEDVEPTDLKWIEKITFESLRKRMEKSKKIHDGNSKGWATSHWGWRPRNSSSELDQENKSKTTQKQVDSENKNNEEEDILSNDNILEEEDKRNNKRKGYWEFKKCLLSDEEYQKVITDYWLKNWTLLINKVDNYCASKWRAYKNYVAAIRNFAKTANINKLPTSNQTNDSIRENDIYLQEFLKCD